MKKVQVKVLKACTASGARLIPGDQPVALRTDIAKSLAERGFVEIHSAKPSQASRSKAKAPADRMVGKASNRATGSK